MQAAQQGDPTAMETLLHDCRRDLRRYAQATCAVSHLDDAVQEALIIVFRAVPQLRSATALHRWLFQIVRRECLRLERKFSRGDFPIDLAGEEHFLRCHPAPALYIEVKMALESLPPLYREVIVLRDMEERTVKEIAAYLSVPVETVKTRIHRARVLMREYLLCEGEK